MKRFKVIFSDLMNVASRKACCIILTRSRTNPHHNITAQYQHQEAIQFQAAEDTIGKENAWDSNRRPFVSQYNALTSRSPVSP